MSVVSTEALESMCERCRLAYGNLDAQEQPEYADDLKKLDWINRMLYRERDLEESETVDIYNKLNTLGQNLDVKWV